MENKDVLRASVAARCRALTEDEVISGDLGIFAQLITLPAYIAAPTVFAYCSVGREVDTRRLITYSLVQGKTVALPVVLGGGEMVFAAIQSLGGLHSGSFGIPEPDKTCPRLIPESRDIMVVPALAYDHAGFRLGHGGGYYDRYLADCCCFTVGLCREVNLMDEVPREQHDVAVHLVVTENRVARPPREPRRLFDL
jgi:5-formyltetrahydrofolate cyclo-ligase